VEKLHGGHLASNLSTHHDNGLELSNIEIDKTSSRPDYSILVYPVITMKPPYAHMGSRKNLLGEIPNEEYVTYFSNELQVREDTPPAILFHTDQDEGVPAENSIKYYLSLRKYKIPAEIHIWQSGIHGLGLAKDDELPFKNWPKTCEQWMIDRKIIDK
jgi:acetyl esterase/lipase